MLNARLYNEAFTSRARSIPRSPYCLSEEHTAAVCQFNPNPPIVGWLQDPRQFLTPSGSPAQPQGLGVVVAAAPREVCRNYNSEQCFFAHCRFSHTCSECQGHYPATRCPQSLANRARGRDRGRAGCPRGTTHTGDSQRMQAGSTDANSQRRQGLISRLSVYLLG